MSTADNIVRTLAYFDMFGYPLLSEEIAAFITCAEPSSAIEAALLSLQEQGRVFRLDEFYSLRNDPALAQKRRDGNERAARLLATGFRIGRRLAKFPFVRGVGISGSLSKNYADEDADIDYFIITSANRLWIARSFLHLLKKFSFLRGRQHWYCMNYFIDESALDMPEKNIFIAVELLTLIPVAGEPVFSAFNEANNWTETYLPNYKRTTAIPQPAIQTGRRWIEQLLNHKAGDLLDDYLMKLTGSRWQKKERENKRNMKGQPMSLRVGKHYARPNPDHFQKRILELYASKLNSLN